MTSPPDDNPACYRRIPASSSLPANWRRKIIDHYSTELAENVKNHVLLAMRLLSQITAEVGGSRTVKAKAMCPQVMT